MGNGADSGRQHGPQSPEQIRNVVLVGPAGAGKSTLFEALITARTPGRHVRGEPGPSQSLGAASIASGDLEINLLDTPGNPDFVGEVRAGLRAADAVLFVVSAADEIDDATRLLWRECEAIHVPRAIAVTKLEQTRADFEESIARCRRIFGDVQPVGVPLIEDGHVVGAINLLRRSVTDYRSGELSLGNLMKPKPRSSRRTGIR
jgi:elongation factor G